jgi:LemA protein
MKKQGQAALVLIILLALIVAVGGFGMMTYNRLVRLHELVPAAWSQVVNVLQRRNDLIPNLVETVKGYAKHEQKVFGDISLALQSFNRATTIQDKITTSDNISGLLSRILAVSLQYPNLKANESFNRLQDELAGTENRIAVERMRFNETVQAYNSLVKTFPTNIIARLGGFTASETYFKADAPAHTAPQVKF